MKYLIFLFIRSGNELRHGIEFHSTRKTFRVQHKVVNESVLTLGSQVPIAPRLFVHTPGYSINYNSLA